MHINMIAHSAKFKNCEGMGVGTLSFHTAVGNRRPSNSTMACLACNHICGSKHDIEPLIITYLLSSAHQKAAASIDDNPALTLTPYICT